MKIQNQNSLKIINCGTISRNEATGSKSYKPKSNRDGFIALIAILIISGIIILISLTVSQLSIAEAQMSLQKSQSSQAYYLANLCAEEALMRLEETNGAYAGGSELIENGSCIISVSGNLPAKKVGIEADFQNQIRKIKIIISQISPKIIINSWQEVAEL